MMPYIKIGFIFELLAGNIKSAAKINERAEFLGIKQLPQVVLVANIDNFVQHTRNKRRSAPGLQTKDFERIKEAARNFWKYLHSIRRIKFVILLGATKMIRKSCADVLKDLKPSEEIEKSFYQYYSYYWDRKGIHFN